ncbi:DsbA family protein [Aestuariibius insulae]|uniref:DsbA family protein n=1 Tax=Aestuariibius insulae TaxID=2058287 RepID=UPI00345F0BAC
MRALTLAALLATAAPAMALDLTQMSDADKAAFNAQIRDYLLENPQVLVEAMQVLEDREAEAQAARDVDLIAANRDSLFNDPDSWSGGAEEPDITIVEFLDYRCGYCKRAHPEVAALIEDDPNIRIVVKEFPILGEASVLASRFAIATRLVAGDEAYKQVSDALMTMRGDVTEPALTRLGNTLGIETEEVLARMNSDEVSRIITENRELAQAMGLTGTPSFVMENRMLRGYAPLAAMQQMVDEIRAEG